MRKSNDNSSMSQQMRIRYYVMNLIYRNSGKSVKVPSTRELSRRFGIARSTVQLAFEKLLRDGYLICRQGAATMTNPFSSFILQPQTRNPLIGVKLFEGDAFYYGINFWRALSSVATELTERNFNIRLLMNAATTEESINREIEESYLDGVILIGSGMAYVNAARKHRLPCVVIGSAIPADLPFSIRKSQEKAIRQLADLSVTRKMTCGLNIGGVASEENLHIHRRLAELNPALSMELCDPNTIPDMSVWLRERLFHNPPELILHFEQYAELLQKFAEESGREILLISRQPPARDVHYRGLSFVYPLDRIAAAAADLLERRLAGEEDLPQLVFEAELKERSSIQRGEQ